MQAALGNSVDLRDRTASVVPAITGVGPEELAAAFAHCREITRRRARNFYYGLRLTPEPRRSAIYAIYAWMRAADDAVDESGTVAEREARLRRFSVWTEQLLGEAVSGRLGLGMDLPTAGHLGIALAATVASYPIGTAIFRDMLIGLRRDIKGHDITDDADLTRYCYCVAGTAGLACVAIWGLRDGADPAAARDLALRRGQAFQRTNILRDFAEDFDGAEGPRRVYIPQDALVRHRLTAEQLRAWAPVEECEVLIREQAGLAREHYILSADLETMIDPGCAPTLWAMTRIYSGLLEHIEADPSRAVGGGGGRVRLAPAAKATIALRAALGARMRRW